MTTTNINIRIDNKTKKDAEAIFKELGLNMTTAINIFLKQAIRSKSLPYEVRIDIPNEETIKAFKESDEVA